MNRAFIKLAIATVFLSAASFTHAASPVDFLGIAWGSPSSTVRQVISARPGVTFVEEQPAFVTFRGGTFGNEDVETWRFEFTDAKFRKATVLFTPKWGKDAKGFLNDHIETRTRQLIQEKYGKPQFISDVNHRSNNWHFTDALTPGASRHIELFHWWSPDRRIGVTYSDTPATPATTTKRNPKKDI